jgi:hypothetical protein
MPIILLTNDAGNRAAAAAMGLTAMSLGQYVRSRGDAPELQDLVARQVRVAALQHARAVGALAAVRTRLCFYLGWGLQSFMDDNAMTSAAGSLLRGGLRAVLKQVDFGKLCLRNRVVLAGVYG